MLYLRVQQEVRPPDMMTERQLAGSKEQVRAVHWAAWRTAVQASLVVVIPAYHHGNLKKRHLLFQRLSEKLAAKWSMRARLQIHKDLIGSGAVVPAAIQMADQSRVCQLQDGLNMLGDEATATGSLSEEVDVEAMGLQSLTDKRKARLPVCPGSGGRPPDGLNIMRRGGR